MFFLVSNTVQIGSNHIFNFPSHPPISVSQSTLPKAYLSCCQTPAICTQVLQGHMKELFKKSLNVICCIFSLDSKHIWFSVGSWKGTNWTFSIFCPSSGCHVLDVTFNILEIVPKVTSQDLPNSFAASSSLPSASFHCLWSWSPSSGSVKLSSRCNGTDLIPANRPAGVLFICALWTWPAVWPAFLSEASVLFSPQLFTAGLQ